MSPLFLRVFPVLLATLLATAAYAGAPALVQLEDLTPGTVGEGFGVDYRLQPMHTPALTYFVAASPENHLELWCAGAQDAQARRMRVLVHNGKTNQYYPDLLDTRPYISYGSAVAGEWWERFPTLPGLTYVNDQWGCTVGGRLFFVSHDPRVAFDNTELYVTEGTPESTRIVRDINPGPPGAGIFDLTAFAEGVFFFAEDGLHGKEPWYSDGSAAGTMMLADINPGAGASRAACAVFPFRADRQVAVLGGAVYFFAQDGSGVFALWRSGGAPENTQQVLTIAPSPGTQMRPTALIAADDALFWVMADACGRLQPGDGLPRQLWRSDGTPQGTARLDTFDEFGAHLHDGRIHTGDLCAAGGTAFFIARRGKDGYALWRVSGEGPAERVNGSPVSEAPEGLGLLGTAQGEAVLALLEAVPGSSENLLAPWLPMRATRLWRVGAGGAAVPWPLPEGHTLPIPRFAPVYSDFGVDQTAWIMEDAQGMRRLWVASGREPGGAAAQDIDGREEAFLIPGHPEHETPWLVVRDRPGQLVPAPAGDISRAAGGPTLPGAGTQTTFLLAAHGALFFRVERAAGKAAVFVTRGNPHEATRLFTEPPRAAAHTPRPDYALTWHGGAWHALHEGALVRIEPGDFAKCTLAALDAPAAPPARQAAMASVDGALLVLENTPEAGIRLRAWDSAAEEFRVPGTAIPGDRLGGVAPAGDFAIVDAAKDGQFALWRAGGTEADTRLLRDGLGPITAYVTDGGVVHAAEWQKEHWRIWRTDGTVEGTRDVGTARASFGLGSPVPMVAAPGGRVAFLDTRRGRLRITDGENAQDVRTKAFAGSEVLLSELMAYEGHYFWITGAPNFGALRLWASDGTGDGTRTAHLFDGRMMHGLVKMAATEDALWLAFAASDVHDDVHRELWRYTLEGGAQRMALSSALPGTLWEPGGTEIDAQFAVVDGRVLFMHYTVETGAELWAVAKE